MFEIKSIRCWGGFTLLGLQIRRTHKTNWKTNPSPAEECRPCCSSSSGSYLSILPCHRSFRLSCHRLSASICRGQGAFGLNRWMSCPIDWAAWVPRVWYRSELLPTWACLGHRLCKWLLGRLELDLNGKYMFLIKNNFHSIPTEPNEFCWGLMDQIAARD